MYVMLLFVLVFIDYFLLDLFLVVEKVENIVVMRKKIDLYFRNNVLRFRFVFFLRYY